jgi:tRNA 2-thiouridine synthesizing protein A
MPVIRLQQLAEQLSAGEQIEMHCTDVGVLHDIPAWCRIKGHHMLNAAQQADLIVFLIQLGETS